MQETAFLENILPLDIITEEGTVRGRNKIKMDGLTTSLQAAEVNGPSGDKGQYLWDGTYIVQLDRGITLNSVYHITNMGFASQDQVVFCWGERVTITWLNRTNINIPVILSGCTLDFYNKLLLSYGHLIDFGERVIRSAIASDPGAVGSYPFSDNQYDNPKTAPTSSDATTFNENSSKVVRLPGAELFLDKFGRNIQLTRQPDNEFLITNGKIDSGQDDVSDLTTISEQDEYYSKITNDESDPISSSEPFAPKKINLSQYQQTVKEFKVSGDSDSNRVVKRGILPRFDKWIFKPVVIRSYQSDSDGSVVSGTTHAIRQERGRTTVDSSGNIVYGYVRTITDYGDIKEFVPRHVNQRIVGDNLVSIGGNYDIKLKTTYRLSDGSVNPTNMVHQEMLVDGQYRLRINENMSDQTSNFDMLIKPTGETTITSKKDIVIDSDENIYLGGKEKAESMMLGDKFKSLFEQLGDALTQWTPIPADGGLALKTLLIQFISSYATSKVIGSPNYYLSQNQKVV